MSDIKSLFVIGGGSAGVRSARITAKNGVKVFLAEDTHIGGTCVNRGCIPKKLLMHAEDIICQAKNLQEKGIFGEKADLKKHNHKNLKLAIDQELARLQVIYKKILKESGVELLEGKAKFIDANSIECLGKIYKPDAIIIATGGEPHQLNINGGELALTSNDMFDLTALPEKLAIIGGGYIALEFASIMHSLGVEVVVVHRSEAFLRDFDQEIVEYSLKQMEQQGITIRRQEPVIEIKRLPSKKIELTTKNNEKIIVDQVLNASGRSPRTFDIGLEHTKVIKNKAGYVDVDSEFRSGQENIFALGDIINQGQLTPVAIAQAKRWHAIHILKDKNTNLAEIKSPSAVFTTPQMCFLGESESKLKEKYSDNLKIIRSEFQPLKYAILAKKSRSLIKVIVEKSSSRVLAIHMAGDDSAEILQGFSAGIAKGITLQELNQIIGIHPTAGEEIFSMS